MLHLIPRIAAQYHCDKHVVKMIIESAQLLYTAHWVLSPSGVPEFAYKKCHVNHPSGIWVRESIENYEWLCELAIELCAEFRYRYGKVHGTQKHIEWLIRNPPFHIPAVHMTPLRLAMPDEYKCDDPVKAYRTFYIESKHKQRGIVSYKKREWPEFLMIK